MSARDLWEAMTAPTNEEIELERLDKERAMLWRTVDRLEREKADLRQEVARLLEALQDAEGMREVRLEKARLPVEVHINIG